MAKVLKFELLSKDEVCTRVEYNPSTKEIKCEQLSPVFYKTVFGKRPHTVDNLLDFFKERVWEETRYDLDEILESLGLREYDPLSICRITHGKCWEDDMWIRFEGESLQWDDIK